ncbi:hypothetical protein BHYA_0028g00420 [Botrytis hyacinthi]|uniref:Uncharacterized protein n=1 Tax=Botrytis hyacinthi TaxID=278943 RepID=A0A4Z1H1G0_9HELO|nr:hypothetical protein BHYA_0028g00420 [Botrytis hyacinthi]
MTPRRMVHDRVKRLLPTQLCNQDEKRQSSNIATWRSDKSVGGTGTSPRQDRGDLEFQPASSHLHARLDARHKERQRDFGT